MTRMDIFNMIHSSSDGFTTKKLDEVEGELIYDSSFNVEKKRSFSSFCLDFQFFMQESDSSKAFFMSHIRFL